MLKSSVRVALCVAALLVPSLVLAVDKVCICPQADLWQPVAGTSAYWVYRYTRDENDMVCSDDDLESDIYYDSTGYSPIPSAYCVDADRCSQCFQLNFTRAHVPETNFVKKSWDADHGLFGTWDLLRTAYVKFNITDGSPARYAKLFLLTHPRTKMMLGYGFEIDQPDPARVNPASIITVGPNRCVPLKVYYRFGPNEVRESVTPAFRKFTLGNVKYFVRAEYAPNEAAPAKDAAPTEKTGKVSCCQGSPMVQPSVPSAAP